MIKSNIDFSLPYITTESPGIGGQLRTKAEHFVVEEIPLYAPEGEGQHLYVSLTKVGLTTKEVEQRLTSLFGLGKNGVGFAGMKDKHAQTTQTFSLSLGYIDGGVADGSAAAKAADRIREHLPVTVHWARWHQNKLKLGHLRGNRFRIIVTGLDVAAGTAQPLADIAQQRAIEIADKLRAQGVANFFGPQRFGFQGANVQKGLEILRGKRYIKDRWLRRFLVSSYQSYLCNRYLAQRIAMGAFTHLLEGDVAKKYDTGGMFDVTDLDAEQPRYAAHEISFTAPMYGPKMWEAKGEAGVLEEKILTAAECTLAQLRRAKIDGTRRLGRLLLPDLVISPAPAEVAQKYPDSILLTFSLPKGAFATTVLREFMKVDLSEIVEEDG